MSGTIKTWISAYLIGVAEEYGANLTSIPKIKKKKKVQVVEFLTYSEDDVIWGNISDKEYLIPVRFSRDAVLEYKKLSTSRITQYKTAVISIKDFRPFFARVPVGRGRMSTDPFLAIECDSFSTIGSYGEAKFGNPKPLERNSDLLEWSEGLRKEGGAGNCLKNRKKVQEESIKSSKSISRPSVPQVASTTTTGKISRKKESSSLHRPGMSSASSWAITKDILFQKPPPEVARLHLNMKVDGDLNNESEEASTAESPHKRRRISALLTPSPRIPDSRSRSRSATPISEKEWPASDPVPRVLSSPPPSLPPSHDDLLAQAKSEAQSTTDPFPPISAQRQGRSKEQVSGLSSSPLSSQGAIAEETNLSPCVAITPPMHARREVSRKVPHPLQSIPVFRLTGEPIILVPNSDTSLSYSQSQSQSQPSCASQVVVPSYSAGFPKISDKPQACESRENDSPDGHNPKATEEYDVTHTPGSLSSGYPTQGYDGNQSSPSVLHPNRRVRRPPISSLRSNDKACSNERSLSLGREAEGDQDNDDNVKCDGRSLDNPPHDSSQPNFSCRQSSHNEGDDELAGISLIVHPSETQQQHTALDVVDIATRKGGCLEEHNDLIVTSQKSEVQHVGGRRSQTFDVNKELDDDDLQTHADLFGPSLRSQESQTQQPSPPLSVIVPYPARKRKLEADAVNKAPTSPKLNSGEWSAVIINSMERPGNGKERSHGIAESAVRKVQHDANAWRVPSFMRTSSNKDETNVMFTDQDYGKLSKDIRSLALKQSRLVNEIHEHALTIHHKAGVSRIKETYPVNTSVTSRKGTILRGSSRGDQNRDPAKRNIPVLSAMQSSRYINTSMNGHPASEETPANRLQGTKRVENVLSDDSRVVDESARHHRLKKRRLDVEQIAHGVHDKDAIVVEADHRSRRTQRGEGLKKLNGYYPNLDKITLEEAALVTWDRVREILRLTNDNRWGV